MLVFIFHLEKRFSQIGNMPIFKRRIYPSKKERKKKTPHRNVVFRILFLLCLSPFLVTNGWNKKKKKNSTTSMRRMCGKFVKFTIDDGTMISETKKFHWKMEKSLCQRSMRRNELNSFVPLFLQMELIVRKHVICFFFSSKSKNAENVI